MPNSAGILSRRCSGSLTLYAALVLPFFLAGTVLIAMFSKYALSIQRLYFWDLVGAGLGSIVAIPVMLASRRAA